MTIITRRAALGGIALLSEGAAIATDSSAEDSDNMVSMSAEQFRTALEITFWFAKASPDERQHALAALRGEQQLRSEGSA